jgi:hypothetical protein
LLYNYFSVFAGVGAKAVTSTTAFCVSDCIKLHNSRKCPLQLHMLLFITTDAPALVQRGKQHVKNSRNFGKKWCVKIQVCRGNHSHALTLPEGSTTFSRIEAAD